MRKNIKKASKTEIKKRFGKLLVREKSKEESDHVEKVTA